MLSFKEKRAIKVYEVHLEEPEKAQEIIDEILETEQSTRINENHINMFTGYGSPLFKRFEVALIDNGIKTISKNPYHSPQYSDWTLGDIITDTITFSAPYTLALGAENFTFGPYEYASLLERSKRSNELIRVANKANIDELGQLLRCFDNNPDALDVFLRTHYPDLLYLRKYIECIRLDQIEEFSLESPIDKPDSITVLERAASNTEVAMKLNLTFKGRKN